MPAPDFVESIRKDFRFVASMQGHVQERQQVLDWLQYWLNEGEANYQMMGTDPAGFEFIKECYRKEAEFMALNVDTVRYVM